MAPSYVVRALSPSEAADGARAWNDLAHGTLDEPTISKIEALMIDERLPDEAGDDLARAAIDWLRGRGVSSISHLRDPDSPTAFWERLGFRPDLLRYTLAD